MGIMQRRIHTIIAILEQNQWDSVKMFRCRYLTETDNIMVYGVVLRISIKSPIEIKLLRNMFYVIGLFTECHVNMYSMYY